MKSAPLTLIILLAACSSPEATRVRGGGAGGDVGNRPEVLSMHEGSRPYYQTPRLVNLETPSLDSARDARESARQ